MTRSLEIALTKLIDMQRQAVAWEKGSLMVLAGPGSGKTQVLTCRIAKLLDSSREKNFRVLALTFTNRAADEMKRRVSEFVPGLEERANIGTFHSFCAQMLRQHGVHSGIHPDFTIYTTDDDRRSVLEDALSRANSQGKAVATDDVRYLGLIDLMKAELVNPDEAESALAHFEDRERIVLVYRLYEEELRRINAMDFNSLILEAHRLATTFPAIAARYRKTHTYWLIDEFQDTTAAQYTFVRALAGDEFRNLFVVADDDQIIYQWNGASFKQIQSFLVNFSSQLIQLPTNWRCPPAIVEAANQLVVYNAHRTSNKKPLIAGRTDLRYPPSEHIQLRVFTTDDEEANGIAHEVADREKSQWGQTTILARNRSLLQRMHKVLSEYHVPSVVAQRRNDFLSAEFRFLVANLHQLARPLDQRNVIVLVESFNRVAGINVVANQVILTAEATGRSYFETWLELATGLASETICATFIEPLTPLKNNPSLAKTVIDQIIARFGAKTVEADADSDLAEDLAAWNEISRDIAGQIGKNAPLDQFLQELQLRSKDPTPRPGAVTLMTIHGAKGKEFDIVYVIGLAEDVMPSFQSKKKGDRSPEMEEERRNCFVAITRTKECLVLSRAEWYRGWQKKPSRFLVEMGLID